MNAAITLRHLPSGFTQAECTCGYYGPVLDEIAGLQSCEDHDVTAHGLIVHTHVSQPAVLRCDSCNRKVSNKQADKYDALGVDWALCPKCERS